MESLSFQERMRSEGLFARTVSVDHLEELREDIDALRRKGLFDPTFDEQNLSFFEFAVPAELPNARTIVVVAKPQPAVAVTFRWRGREVPLTVPPTYANAREVDAAALAALERITSPAAPRFIKAMLPLKTLAARSGLAGYGRNNLAYMPVFGSFHRLTAFFSDLPGEDQWQERELMAGCDSCDACVKACPTGAIPPARTLIRADRCLTYLNEMPSAVPFPEWLPSGAHNALIGCLRCQRACPYNRNVASWTEVRETFSEEETELLLAGDTGGRMAERLCRIGLDPDVLPRNLAVLLRAREEA